MPSRRLGGRKCRSNEALFVAISAALGAIPALSFGQVTLTKTSNTDWTITNGSITAVFNPTNEDITNVQLGTSANLLGGTTAELDEEFAGTPFGTGTQTFEDQIGPSNSYVDVWTNVASTGTTVNPITYAFHYLIFANDPTIYCYEVLNHAATDPATNVGQGQFLFRSNPTTFPNLYQINTGPNQLGTANAQTTIGVPSTNANFETVANESTGSGTSQVFYRSVQNAAYDLAGSGISGDNGTNFFTKYDYSVYTQFFQAETMYGSQYAVTEVDPSTDTLTGGPTKQELAWTDPGILNMEFLSDHYGIGSNPTTTYPGYEYVPTQGIAQSKLYGPYGFTISSDSSTTAAQINQNAINAISNDQSEFATDSELISSGYIPNSSRGSVQINAANSAGWSSNTANNTVVLSEPGVNFQESTQGNQYIGQISQTGSVSINNVVPCTYRMSLYELGQWGETRVDGVQVQNGQVTIPQNVKFTPENFGTAAPIWTIGTPNRSANEFMNGHTSTGTDLREYQGAYDFWGEEQALGTPGYVSYNATATTIGGVAEPATNNPNDWIANQWYTFDPGLYDSTDLTTDNYNNTAPQYVKNAGGPGGYHGAPWQVHFETTAAQNAQGQYVVLSVGLAAMDANLTVSLNGNAETWTAAGFSVNDPMVRSGDAGFYQWAAFQFPTSDLSAIGTDNEFTFTVGSSAEGVMYDAIRMEITNTSSAPSVTGWDDYTYINGSTQIVQNDAVSIATLTWDNAGATGDGKTWDNGTNQNWTTGVVSWENSANAATFSSGANTVFNDSNNGNYNVTLNTTVTPNSILVSNSSGNYVISGTGTIAGSGGLAKYGTSTATLACTCIYTGGTTISGGSLQIGNGGTSGSVAGNITDNANLAFNRTDSITFSGNISGTGSLTQLGTGTVAITGSCTYTGGTTISAGSLQIGNGGSTGSIAGNITDNANLTFDTTSSVSPGTISGTGGITEDQPGQVYLGFANTYGGNTVVNNGDLFCAVTNALPVTTSLTLNGGTLVFGNPNVSLTVASLAGAGNVQLTEGVNTNEIFTVNQSVNTIYSGVIYDDTYFGDADNGQLIKQGNGNLTLTGNNVYGGGTTISGGSLQLGNGGTSGSITGNVTDNANLAFNRTDSIAFAGNITGTGSLIQSGTGTVALTGTCTYTGGTTISAGSLQIGSGGTTGSITGNITDNANLTYDLSSNPSISAIISGSGSLTQAGSGVLTLTSSNTYTGNTTINNGVLVAGVNNALPTTTNLTINNGYLGINPGVTQTIASLAGVGNGIGFASGILIVDQSINTEFDGFIYDGNEFGQPTELGELIKEGSGKLTLTGNNDYYGGTTISGGILQIGTGGSLGSIPGNILDNAQLTYNLDISSTISGTISGTGSMTQMGGGTLILTATNTYTGGTTIASASTLQIGNGGTTGSISNTGAIIDNGNLTFDRTDSITFPNYVHGIGSITQAGTGTVTLSASNNNNGGTNVTAGKLIIGAVDGLAEAPVSITGGVLQLAQNTDQEIITSLALSGTGVLDITNNSLLIDYGSGFDPIASIAQWIKNGFYGLSGPQIISSVITADDALSGLSYGIGCADGADGVVSGLPSGEIEIMFTLLGDANLDGTVNSEDFTLYSHNVGQTGMWDDGDFNYDGTVNAEDYTLFAHNDGQSAVLAASAGNLQVANGISLANVPEPACAGMIVVAGLGVLGRRRRSWRHQVKFT
jgi:autotransporter-associated beta strand protein